MSKKWLAAATLLPWAAFAQNPSGSSEHNTEPTEITIYNKIKQDATTALVPVEVITRADIERRQPRSLVDLLETMPGMQFGSQNGGIGQQTSLFVRGTNSDQVLVLVNGRPQAQLANSNFDFSQLPVNNVERIEYIRGPRAAIYGSSAIGGVINIITTSEQNQSAKIGVTAGSNDYYAADFTVNQWVTDATRLQLATGYRKTRGYNIIPEGADPDRDGFDSKNLTLGIEHKLGHAWTWDANFNGWKSNLDFDDVWGGADKSQTETYQLDTGLKYEDQQLSGQLNASYNEYDSLTWNKVSGQNPATDSRTNVATTRIDGFTQYKYSGLGYVLAGMDWQQDRLLSKSRGFGGSKYEIPDRDNTGVFTSIYHTWNPVSFELTGRIDDNEQYGTHGTWQSALSLALPERHRATLSYGTAFKAPNFQDLSSAKDQKTLQAEKSQNWELGFTGDYNLFNWQLNFYRNEIDNLIVYEGFNTVNSTANTDALIRGAELVVKATTGPVHHAFSFDYTNAKDIKAADQLVNRAKRKASWIGDLDVADANFFAQVLYVGERETFGPKVKADSPSYTIWNIGARYPLTQQLTLNGKINNLFDKKYQVLDGYDSPDMEFYVGADYRF